MEAHTQDAYEAHTNKALDIEKIHVDDRQAAPRNPKKSTSNSNQENNG